MKKPVVDTPYKNSWADQMTRTAIEIVPLELTAELFTHAMVFDVDIPKYTYRSKEQ